MPEPPPSPRCPNEGDSPPIPQISSPHANQPKSTPDPCAASSDLPPSGFNAASTPQMAEISLDVEENSSSSEEPVMADSSLPNRIIEDVGEAQILEELASDIRYLLQDPMAGAAQALAQPAVQAAATVRDSKSRGSKDEARQDTSGSNQPAQKTAKLCDTTEIGPKHSISKLRNQNGSNVEDRNSTPSLNCQEGEIGAILKNKSKGTEGSNQRS